MRRLNWGRISEDRHQGAGQLWGVPPSDNRPCQRNSRGPEGARTVDWISAPPPLLSSDLGKCALLALVLAGEGVGQAGRRRLWARQEEEKARWEREWLARLRIFAEEIFFN